MGERHAVLEEHVRHAGIGGEQRLAFRERAARATGTRRRRRRRARSPGRTPRATAAWRPPRCSVAHPLTAPGTVMGSGPCSGRAVPYRARRATGSTAAGALPLALSGDRGAIRALHQREQVTAHAAVVGVADRERDGRRERRVDGVASPLERDRTGLRGQGMWGRDRPLLAGGMKFHAAQCCRSVLSRRGTGARRPRTRRAPGPARGALARRAPRPARRAGMRRWPPTRCASSADSATRSA